MAKNKNPLYGGSTCHRHRRGRGNERAAGQVTQIVTKRYAKRV